MSDDYRSTLEELIGDARVMFWCCPIPEHGDRKGQVIVEWVGGVAHCTADGCDLTSTSPTERNDHE